MLALLATYYDLCGEEDCYCPVSSPECVSQERSDERREECSPNPGGHSRRSVDVALVEKATDSVNSPASKGMHKWLNLFNMV